jgi:hypothetical protein
VLEKSTQLPSGQEPKCNLCYLHDLQASLLVAENGRAYIHELPELTCVGEVVERPTGITGPHHAEQSDSGVDGEGQ